MVCIRSYAQLIHSLWELAKLPSVELKNIGEFEVEAQTYPLFLIQMGTQSSDKFGVLIAAGIHGDEAAGVEAALRFVESNAGNQELLSRFFFVIFPCNNPTGWECNTRENWRGADLNRQFAAKKTEPEAAIIMQALQGRCFDLVYEMHEDVDAPGFYLYELAENSDHYVGEDIIKAVSDLGCPINQDECIEGMPAENGLIRRGKIKFRKTRIPQAIYVHRTCGGHVITVEPPASMLTFEERVKVLLTGLDLALEALSSQKAPA